MTWPWPTGRSGGRLKPTQSLPSLRRSTPGRSRRMPSSWSASRTWTPAVMRKPWLRWKDIWPPILRGDVAEFAMAHLVMARLGMGQPDAAWKMLARLAREFPESKSLPPARLRVAEAALEAHQAERAAEQFKLVAAAMQENRARRRCAGRRQAGGSERSGARGRAYRGLGKALDELGKPDEAAAAFGAALELAPDDPAAAEVALAQARALEVGRETDAALKAYSHRSGPLCQIERGRARRSAARPAAGQSRPARRGVRRIRAADRRRACSRQPEQMPGVKPDGLLAEWGWSLIDAEKPAEADRVFGRLAQGASG